ncbi:MAG: thymidine phosphorylase, partial [Brucellaceae bacterium]|nr:thymidine phosphorylase [Brucellaceae bacterium]
EAQVSAFAMAVFLNGMEPEETVTLTRAMRDSGDVLDWSKLDGPVVDKHSTGGVGDNVSLMLAPIVAACGAYVPMISGRGLGHTGGTLDKMESIPGYTVQPDNKTFRKTVKKAGCAIIGQTGNLAPADKRFYAIRDVTGTVESIPLITASILSKKLAAGLQALVLDVKSGNGAFMATTREATQLADSLVTVAKGAGLRTVALLTDMNEPLASAAGNAVEVRNAIDFLTGAARDPRLENVTLALAGEMLLASGISSNVSNTLRMAQAALHDGRAAETFARMVTMLGGPADLMDDPDKHLPKATIVREVRASSSGFVTDIDTRGIGVAVVELGGGRRTTADRIDPSVGLTGLVGIGTQVSRGDPLAVVHARDDASAEAAIKAVRKCYTIGEEKPRIRRAVMKRID